MKSTVRWTLCTAALLLSVSLPRTASAGRYFAVAIPWEMRATGFFGAVPDTRLTAMGGALFDAGIGAMGFGQVGVARMGVRGGVGFGLGLGLVSPEGTDSVTSQAAVYRLPFSMGMFICPGAAAGRGTTLGLDYTFQSISIGGEQIHGGFQGSGVRFTVDSGRPQVDGSSGHFRLSLEYYAASDSAPRFIGLGLGFVRY